MDEYHEDPIPDLLLDTGSPHRCEDPSESDKVLVSPQTWHDWDFDVLRDLTYRQELWLESDCDEEHENGDVESVLFENGEFLNTSSCSFGNEGYCSAELNSSEGQVTGVRYEDYSKPYILKISSPTLYRKFLELVSPHDVGSPTTTAADSKHCLIVVDTQSSYNKRTKVIQLSSSNIVAKIKAFMRRHRLKFKGEDAYPATTPDSGISDSFNALSPEEQEKQRAEWKHELENTEREINTMREVLNSRIRHAQELKRKLGITVWKEFQDDMNQGIQNVKESTVYQKTSGAIKSTAEKTTSLLGGIGSSISAKFGDMKNSQAFKSFEEKVGSAVSSVKMGASRSNSTSSFDEALKEAEANKDKTTESSSPKAVTPIIPEEKPLS